jgi:hypothetical protein
MTIHFHGGPITPNRVLIEEMAGANFFVSYAAAAQIRTCHEIGQQNWIDWPAFSIWKRGLEPDFDGYYRFIEPWLDYPTTVATIPDLIEGDEADNSRLVRAWPHEKHKGVPVYHLHEPVRRLLTLIEAFPRIAMGSSGAYSEVLSAPWERRMDECWREITRIFKRTPSVHMMRGMQTIGKRWPFASVDSTDIARNHNRDGNTAAKMRARWDAGQCPPRFIDPGEQLELAA